MKHVVPKLVKVRQNQQTKEPDSDVYIFLTSNSQASNFGNKSLSVTLSAESPAALKTDPSVE